MKRYKCDHELDGKESMIESVDGEYVREDDVRKLLREIVDAVNDGKMISIEEGGEENKFIVTITTIVQHRDRRWNWR